MTHEPCPATDEYFEAIPTRVAPSEIRRLSRIDPVRAAGTIAVHWVGIGAAVWLCSRSGNLAAYLLAVAWIGARQHALGILMHEGSHYLLFPNKQTNDWATNLFCAWPLLGGVDAYRRNHWPHHRRPNSPDDPLWTSRKTADWEFPMTRRRLALMLLGDFTGLNFFHQISRMHTLRREREAESPATLSYRIVRAAFYFVVAAALTATGAWKGFFFYWIIPLSTWLLMVLRIRGIAEHYAVSYDHVLTQTRTTLPTWVDHVFVGPCNVGYHMEHHLHPSVPFYNLPELHRLLMQDPIFRERAHLTRGYAGVLRECVTGSPDWSSRLAPTVPLAPSERR